jgi:hypothetical protein
MAVQQIALDLKADHDEEQHHQRVVDPMQHAQPEHLARERRAIKSRRRRIGDRERNRRTADEHQPAACFMGQQTAKRRSRTMAGWRCHEF